MKLKLLFLSIFIFVHHNFVGMSFSARSKQIFNKIKSFPSNFYKRYKGREARKTRGQSFKTGAFNNNKTQFKNQPKKGYIAGGILASLYAALWPKVNAKAEGNIKASDKKEEIKKAALKSWRKEIKNPDAFDDKKLPEDIKKILDAHMEEIALLRMHEVFYFLPGYIVKEDKYNRIEGAKAMTQIIDQYNLTKLFVPKKYSYDAPNGIRYVVAKFVEQSNEPVTKEEIEQLFFLARKLRWIDSKYGNFLKTPHGIALIDTETDDVMDKGMVRNYITINDIAKKQLLKAKKIFLPVPKRVKDENDILKKKRIIESIYYGTNSSLTPEAIKYLQEKKEYYQNRK